MIEQPNIIQYVECNQETGPRDWPDCYEDCPDGEDNCPVKKRIRKDCISGEYLKVLRYTIWPD